MRLIFFLSCVNLLSCVSNLDNVLSPAGRQSDNLAKKLKYSFNLTDGSICDLSKDSGKVTVLIFASETCFTCSEETELIVGSLKNPEISPPKINLYTILAGTIYLEDAQWWKEIHEVPWPVGMDPKAKLLKTMCPKDIVPCIIVNDPKEGIIFRHNGKVDLLYLKSITGPWE